MLNQEDEVQEWKMKLIELVKTKTTDSKLLKWSIESSTLLTISFFIEIVKLEVVTLFTASSQETRIPG